MLAKDLTCGTRLVTTKGRILFIRAISRTDTHVILQFSGGHGATLANETRVKVA